jgi:exosortase A-associated hydrolase 2
VGIDAFFLPLRQGERFCVLHEPAMQAHADAPQRGVVFVHAFAEEMNKSRRVVSLQARAFADAGWTVLQPDLYGCGDSPGDFSDAEWERWVDDVVDATAWLRTKTGRAPALWGLRAGCLVASAAAKRSNEPTDLILWQPVASGAQFLRQFLRVSSASGIVAQTGASSTLQELREKLGQGGTVEIAGYCLSPELALGLEAAQLEPGSSAGRVAWLEVRGTGGAEVSPASRTCISRFEAAGHSVDARVIAGPAFWQNLEITDCPALIEATVAMTGAWHR